MESQPQNQKKTKHYQNVLASLKKHGQINPLICIKQGDRYAVCVGNNRFLAGLELGFKEFDIAITLKDDSKSLRTLTQSLYRKTDVLP